jgi:hypothetical protein
MISGIVWPTIIIRLCQFHIIQALSRWGKSKPSNKKGKEKNLHHKLNDEALQELLVIFRHAELIQNGPNSKLHSTVSLMPFLPNMIAMPMQSKFI